MKINKTGLELIKKYEGFKSDAYKCPAGKLTIGYGHLILPGENLTTITEEQAEEILKKDLQIAENAVNDLVKIKLNNNQFSALVSFTFNLGKRRLKDSTLLVKVNLKEFLYCPRSFVEWCHIGKKKIRGLLKRRLEEALLFVS